MSYLKKRIDKTMSPIIAINNRIYVCLDLDSG